MSKGYLANLNQEHGKVVQKIKAVEQEQTQQPLHGFCLWENENVSGNAHHLHHHDSCLCDIGKLGKKKKEEANKKRCRYHHISSTFTKPA